MSRPTTINVAYRIVTPMFCGGANQERAELRLSSFKGALRFWWRSLMWSELEKKNHRVNSLWEREANLFGSSEKTIGQSNVRMRLSKVNIEPPNQKGKVFERRRLAGVHYLGYGLMKAFGKNAGQLERAMIPKGCFEVELRVRSTVSREDCECLKKAIILLGTVGGLGSRSRKGFGSLTLTSFRVDGDDIALPDLLEDRLRLSLKTPLSGDLPEWTAWSQPARVLKLTWNNRSDACELLDQIGREQVFFRSWGRKGQVLRAESERNFKSDHDLSKGLSQKVQYPARVAFGLPHAYQGKTVKPASKSLNRRASPLFIHIHQVDSDADPEGVVSFLPSRFLPDGKVEAFGRTVAVNSGDELWYPLHAFLDRLNTSDDSPPGKRPGFEQFPADSEWWKKNNPDLKGVEVQFG